MVDGASSVRSKGEGLLQGAGCVGERGPSWRGASEEGRGGTGAGAAG